MASSVGSGVWRVNDAAIPRVVLSVRVCGTDRPLTLFLDSSLSLAEREGLVGAEEFRGAADALDVVRRFQQEDQALHAVLLERGARWRCRVEIRIAECSEHRRDEVGGIASGCRVRFPCRLDQFGEPWKRPSVTPSRPPASPQAISTASTATS